jgi:hypothetical protein
MLVKSKATVSEAWVRENARMKREKKLEIDASKALIRQRRQLGLEGKREGRVGAKSRHAVLHAVRTMGKEILTEAGEDYWRFLERKYPWQALDGRPQGTDSINGHRNRHGKVSLRKVGGRWYRWERGRWVEEVERKQQ